MFVITYAQKEKLKPLSPKNYFWSAFLCSDELASHSLLIPHPKL